MDVTLHFCCKVKNTKTYKPLWGFRYCVESLLNHFFGICLYLSLFFISQTNLLLSCVFTQATHYTNNYWSALCSNRFNSQFICLYSNFHYYFSYLPKSTTFLRQLPRCNFSMHNQWGNENLELLLSKHQYLYFMLNILFLSKLD